MQIKDIEAMEKIEATIREQGYELQAFTAETVTGAMLEPETVFIAKFTRPDRCRPEAHRFFQGDYPLPYTYSAGLTSK
ncbi:MAG: hypothetical protein FWC36_00330 [Spirochaetes bacterium]|nr:hypothetical protein [Spirochaetota bacterium]